MSGRQKVLLVGLAVLLVTLFVVAVGGGRDDRGDPGSRSGLVDLLGRVAGDRAAVDPATVDADCDTGGGRLAFTGGCALRVADPGGLRTLVLRSPARFTVRAPAPGTADLTVAATATAPAGGGEVVARVAVDAETTVLLGCPAAGGCTVTVAPS